MIFDKLKAHAAVLACAALAVLLAVQSWRLHSAQLDAAQARTTLATHTATAERAARLQSEKFRALETKHRDRIHAINQETTAALAAARTDARRADAAAGRLRTDLASFVIAHRARAQAAAAAGQCTPDAGPSIGVLAELFQRADARAGELGKIADDARARGLGCERSYDAVGG